MSTYYCLVLYTDTGEHYVFCGDKNYNTNMWTSGTGVKLTDALKKNGFEEIRKDHVTTGINKANATKTKRTNSQFENDIYAQAVKGEKVKFDSYNEYYGGGPAPHGIMKIEKYSSNDFPDNFRVIYTSGSSLNTELQKISEDLVRDFILYHTGTISQGCLIMPNTNNDLVDYLRGIKNALDNSTVIVTSRAVENGSVDEDVLMQANLFVGKNGFKSSDTKRQRYEKQLAAHQSSFIRYLSAFTDSGLRSHMDGFQRAEIDGLFAMALDEQETGDGLEKINTHITAIDKRIRLYTKAQIDSGILKDSSGIDLMAKTERKEWIDLRKYFDLRELYNNNDIEALVEGYSFDEIKILADSSSKWRLLETLHDLKAHASLEMPAGENSYHKHAFNSINYKTWSDFFAAMELAEDELAAVHLEQLISEFEQGIADQQDLFDPMTKMMDIQQPVLENFAANFDIADTASYWDAIGAEQSQHGFVVSDFAKLADKHLLGLESKSSFENEYDTPHLAPEHIQAPLENYSNSYEEYQAKNLSLISSHNFELTASQQAFMEREQYKMLLRELMREIAWEGSNKSLIS